MANRIFLDTYILQQDMRIRFPKSILSNMNVEKGKSKFDIFFDSDEKSLVLKIHNNENEEASNEKAE